MATAARAMAMAKKRAMARVAKVMARASKTEMARAARAMVTALKRVLTAAARAMATVTKRAMATNGNNTGNGYGKEGDGHLMAATRETVQRTRPLAL